jgi:phosphoribosylanthranilate isomerase
MRTRIKFCGLVRPGDVDTAVALGVDAIGFVFYDKSPRYVAVELAAQLRRRLPSFVAAVGLFVNETDVRIASIAGRVGLDVLQFHGDETPEQCLRNTPAGVAYWRAVRMRGPGDLLESIERYPAAEAWLLDGFSEAYGGSGTGFDWSWVPATPGRRIVASGGLTPDSVGQAIRGLRPFAVDVSSAIQATDPRMKDAERMASFVDAVARADAGNNEQRK